eukprot:scaffold464_cov181-Amphora_coffeaeformis.AAC.31
MVRTISPIIDATIIGAAIRCTGIYGYRRGPGRSMRQKNTSVVVVSTSSYISSVEDPPHHQKIHHLKPSFPSRLGRSFPMISPLLRTHLIGHKSQQKRSSVAAAKRSPRK